MIVGLENCVVVGLGYIGLPTAATIARCGINVVGVDVNQAIVDEVNSGKCTSVEPGLPELVAECVASGRLSAQREMHKGDVFIIAVPTPFEGAFKPDLSYVKAAALAVAPVLEEGNLVLVESTIPVGATEQVARWLATARPDLNFSSRHARAGRTGGVMVAHSPERILPGQMLRELVENDRVIGGVCPRASEAGRSFYRLFVKGDCVATDSRTAELCKLTENAFRDVNIAFANELSVVCGEMDVDVWELISLANRHPRVNILKPGPGVGGHCIAIDPWFIISSLADKTRLIREARWINNSRPRQVVDDIIGTLRASKARSIACLGLTYKADVDDVRESPAVEVVSLLTHDLEIAGSSIEVLVTEPYLKGPLPHELSEAKVSVVDLDRALEADALVLLVDHREFIAIPPEKLAGKILIDTRGVWPQARHSRRGAYAAFQQAAE